MDIEELEEWFRNAPEPEIPVHLNAATKVNDYQFFLSSHFVGLRAAKNEYTRGPLLERLLKMKDYMENTV